MISFIKISITKLRSRQTGQSGLRFKRVVMWMPALGRFGRIKKMKKIICVMLCLSTFSLSVFANGTKWKVVKATDIYGISWDGINFQSNGISLNPGDVVDGLDTSVIEDPSTKKEMIKIKKIVEGYVDISCVEPDNCNVHFEEYILKQNLRKKNKVLVPEVYLQALSKKDRKELIYIEPMGYSEYECNKSDMDYEWYDACAAYLNNSQIYKVSIYLSNIFSYYSFMIRNIKQIEDGYLITVEVSDFKEFEKRSFTLPQKGDVVELKMKLDGDYINFFYQDEVLGKYVIIDDKTSNEIKNLLLNNSYNFSNITWPRHADGSCDYDGSKKTADVQTAKATSSTNVAKNKLMTVKENLKLRSGEATSTQVLAVMQAGTKVKILELGKAESIDGINSNWVKVEVQKGAKDREGKPIKSGTVGWCYGGYLE